MTSKIIFNGQEFASIDEMPEDMRRQYEQVMSSLADDNQRDPSEASEGGDAQVMTAVMTETAVDGQNEAAGDAPAPKIYVNTAPSQSEKVFANTTPAPSERKPELPESQLVIAWVIVIAFLLVVIGLVFWMITNTPGR